MATILLVDDDLMLLNFCNHILARTRRFHVMKAARGAMLKPACVPTIHEGCPTVQSGCAGKL
jgi:hypothetical protein